MTPALALLHQAIASLPLYGVGAEIHGRGHGYTWSYRRTTEPGPFRHFVGRFQHSGANVDFVVAESASRITVQLVERNLRFTKGRTHGASKYEPVDPKCDELHAWVKITTDAGGVGEAVELAAKKLRAHDVPWHDNVNEEPEEEEVELEDD